MATESNLQDLAIDSEELDAILGFSFSGVIVNGESADAVFRANCRNIAGEMIVKNSRFFRPIYQTLDRKHPISLGQIVKELEEFGFRISQEQVLKVLSIFFCFQEINIAGQHLDLYRLRPGITDPIFDTRL